MKRVLYSLAIVVYSTLAVQCTCPAAKCNETKNEQAARLVAPDSLDYEERLNFYLISDGGRNGYYEQKSVAATMGEMTRFVEPEFIVTAGDTHHYNGIRSVQDPIWNSNFESIYTHPELLTDWYAALGNHEYHGNTQAVIDYAKISRRWNMPARYYTKVFDEEGTTVQLVVIDTPALIDKYRNDSDYPDAAEQDMDAQLKWLDETLAASTADWKIVIGHHPIYAYTTKKAIERENMQQRVDPLLRKHNVDLYACGHIHNFQHVREEGSDVDYVVNTSGALARGVKSIDGTQFCKGVPGFSIVSFDKGSMVMHFVDYKGNTIYSFTRKH